MNHHARVCKNLILIVAWALVVVPLCIASEPQEAGSQTSLNSTTGAQPTAKAPRITYEEGQLTIIAENSSLSDVMKALRAALGADIDLPAGVVNQRIWVHLGPGPARRVLRDLLDGTEFNYVIQASESDADGIRSVLLTQRGKSTGAEIAGPAERVTERVAEKGAIRKIPLSGSDVAGAPDSESPASEPVVASNDASQTAPPAAPANNAAASASLQNAPTNSDSSASAGGSPTDQMIQQMQSMFQQRRQIQIQQNQKASPQAPNQ